MKHRSVCRRFLNIHRANIKNHMKYSQTERVSRKLCIHSGRHPAREIKFWTRCLCTCWKKENMLGFYIKIRHTDALEMTCVVCVECSHLISYSSVRFPLVPGFSSEPQSIPDNPQVSTGEFPCCSKPAGRFLLLFPGGRRHVVQSALKQRNWF